tara:strand:+ start:322 stop:1182 length:861 start_codon:yes stop_codon:yes gene_type:complete
MKVLLSILFTITGIYSCFFIDAGQIPIYETYIKSWVFSLLISHLIPSIYLLIGLLLFITKFNVRLLLTSFLITNISLIEIFVFNVFKFDLTLICLFVTLLCSIIFTFLKFKKINTESFLIKNHLLKKILILFLVLFSLLASYIISPIGQYSLVDKPVRNIDKKYSSLLKRYIDFNTPREESVLIALFSSNCNYCFDSAEKIGITQKFKSFKKIISIFSSNLEDAKLFVKNSNYSTSIILSTKNDFLKLTEYHYPKFYLIHKNGSIFSYEASFFQERTIDKLSNAHL